MKILIITDELKTTTLISNYINLNIKNITILIANDISSAKLILNEYTINLILCESHIFNLEFYKENIAPIPIILLNVLYNKYFSENFKTISLDNLSLLSYYLHSYMSLSNTMENTKRLIFKKLMQLGFNIKHKGTKYIAESILILKNHDKISSIQDIYSIVAREHHTTSNNVKSNILKSINYMYCETDFSIIKDFFSLMEDSKPTPKQIIFTILKNV